MLHDEAAVAVLKRETGGTNPMNPLTKFWTWLSNPEHRSTLAFIGGGVAAVAVAAWQVYLHFSPPPTPPALSTVTSAPPIDPEALNRLKGSQEKLLNAETCALDNVTRQIAGSPPLPCPAPTTTP